MKKFAKLPRSLRLPIIGLDISDRQFKFLKLKEKDAEYQIDFFGIGEIPSGIVVSGEIKDSRKLGEALKYELSSHIKDASYAAFSLPEEKGFVRLVELPRINKDEIRQAVKLQLEENIPLPAEEVIFDYEFIDRPGHEKHLDLAISAFPRELIIKYNEALDIAGIKPVVAEAESQAIARAVMPPRTKNAAMIIDYGFTRTSFFIAHMGVVRFTSTVGISGAALNKQISIETKVDAKKAAVSKKEFSFIRSDNPQLYNVIVPYIDNLRTEIEKLLAFWETHEETSTKRVSLHPIDRIYITGGDAHMKGLPEYLSAKLNLPVVRAEPWKHIFNMDKYIPPISAHDMLYYATALGLALRKED